ncbi:hypothetical protein [Candidatus Poriferisodalis sp.]|uniref:hypothetical protein n=1 Tax=Candidatus Poriferisodalis sp. TaxID=3101277 RepID=UPI003AF49A62
MRVARLRIAQACSAVAGAAVFLPWYIDARTGLVGTETLRGISTGVGRLLLVVCIVTIVMVQIGWRPAWIGAGFAGAIAVREILDPSASGTPDPGSGLWITVIGAVVAVVLLGWNMFAGVAADDGSGSDEPPRWFFSGPLGRRR